MSLSWAGVRGGRRLDENGFGRLARNDREQVPCGWDAFELVLAAILELDPGAGDEVFDGA